MLLRVSLRYNKDFEELAKLKWRTIMKMFAAADLEAEKQAQAMPANN